MLEEAKLLEEDYDEKTAKRSWGTKIAVDGITYATSLFWQPLQNKDDPFMEVEEASAGVLEGADLFCIKGGKAPQFGICVSHEGYKSGENVAAVSLASAMSDKASFIAVFKVNEGWWYVCIRNDIILSDGDMLFLKEEDARNQFMSMLAVPDWGRKIAPAEWGIEETEEVQLSGLLSKGVKSKLQKIKALRGAKLLMVVVISAVVGIWLVSSLIDKIFLTPTKRPVVVPVQPKVVPKIEKLPEVKPWEKLNDPTQTMKECYEGVQDVVKIMPPGWEIGPVACSANGVMTSWSMKIGRLSWAQKALDQSGLVFSGRSFSDNGTNLAVTMPLNKISQISSPPMKNMEDLRNTVNDLFQSIGQQISLSRTSYTSPEKTVYPALGFRFSSRYNPIIWTDLLTKFSGLEIKNIKYTPSNETWEYEGIIYAL